MHHLRAVAVENGAIVATAEDGSQYRVELDEELRARLRGPAMGSTGVRRSTPREIQTYIRGGMSAEQVAKYTGAPVEYIQRYELPILAERQYMVETALGVAVSPGQSAGDHDGPPPTFGAVLDARLNQLSATGARWSSWKEPEGGWIVKLAFSADGIDHDARWSFEAKKALLTPLNGEAVALSQQGEVGASLLPRLRAVAHEAHHDNSSRFDSAVFDFPPDDLLIPDPVVPMDTTPTGRIRLPSTRTGPIGVVQQQPVAEPADTTDLLDALRRRRGERESARFDEEREEPRNPITGNVRVLERVRTEQAETTEVRPGTKPGANPATGPVPTKGRRGRTSMPSWDEIVFGARPEEDPA